MSKLLGWTFSLKFEPETLQIYEFQFVYHFDYIPNKIKVGILPKAWFIDLYCILVIDGMQVFYSEMVKYFPKMWLG